MFVILRAIRYSYVLACWCATHAPAFISYITAHTGGYMGSHRAKLTAGSDENTLPVAVPDRYSPLQAGSYYRIARALVVGTMFRTEYV